MPSVCIPIREMNDDWQKGNWSIVLCKTNMCRKRHGMKMISSRNTGWFSGFYSHFFFEGEGGGLSEKFNWEKVYIGIGLYLVYCKEHEFHI